MLNESEKNELRQLHRECHSRNGRPKLDADPEKMQRMTALLEKAKEPGQITKITINVGDEVQVIGQDERFKAIAVLPETNIEAVAIPRRGHIYLKGKPRFWPKWLYNWVKSQIIIENEFKL
jgi:hypothetical protein